MSRANRYFRRGGAVMETAVVLPVLLVLSFGLTEVGHFFYIKHVLQAAAREGARIAILPASDPEAAVDRAMTAAGLSSGLYTVTVDPADADPGEEITVSIECNWGDVGLRPMRLIPESTVLTGTAIMMKEGSTATPPDPPPFPTGP